MKKDLIDIFNANLNECLKHKKKINIAKRFLKPIIPVKTSVYTTLDDINISFIDQLVFRFSKLQDTMGEKIFPMILLLSKENVKRKTFIDIVNRIEELGILYKKEWFKLRESRNKIAHEYSENIDETIENLNAIFEDSQKLIQLFDNTLVFCKEKFELNIKE